MKPKNRVLIAGIGGASLGTEILKSLLLVGRYKIFGCDISQFAYGHYQKDFEKTFVVDSKNYVESLLEICRKADIDFIIPGGEEPMILISESANRFKEEEIHLAINSPEIIKQFSDKGVCFNILSELGFQVPLTKIVNNPGDLEDMTFPCIIKPTKGSGGSNFVFLTNNMNEAILYTKYLSHNGKKALVQEYIPENEGEFTIGVLSLSNRQIACYIALKRIFNSKLSIFSKGNAGLISSGYSQGLIDYFPEQCAIAEKIAVAIKSEGPINVQGRLQNGKFIPFEINPRFSASTYLRTLAGINEVDIYLQYLATGSFEKPGEIRSGYYLRSFSEVFVSKEAIKR